MLQKKKPTKNDGGWTKPKENTGKGTQAKTSKKCIYIYIYIYKKQDSLVYS